jgi:hypothetical protein
MKPLKPYMKLLTIGNPKTQKGRARGYATAVLHLAPWRASGVNVCPMAELAGCNISCLNTAGRGGIAKGRATFAPHGVTLPDNHIQRARIARTLYFAENRNAFMSQLVREISAFLKRCQREGLKAAVRLNGTSDIQWEHIPIYENTPDIGIAIAGFNSWYASIDRAYSSNGIYTIFDRFPAVQFYDYTKLYARVRDTRALPRNYHLTLSWSGASRAYREKVESHARDYRASLAIVAESRREAQLIAASIGYDPRPVVDGDRDDLRFLDPPGSIVFLTPKGSAKRDPSGFVARSA